mmetsp:Transcript_16295/g.36133  ORF Transcript_16295/g.36133 Transcript_16295/m.36133 type:complete len:323 (+) Transcript_16295:48-1016(+)|eukprot:CAMPEP_0204368438 /NCGR_PEP_ID=MMETSP0469-20131031/44180_1 /ASSEMBLY_ACC=CAM_ASM_000384 /TAXON_ID=2969 /ORGANISM="Oxyrrhis marina" /LENGTH=322 /DNA_ID=CAMNT_0051357995 /DNA_START=18 /DNA_END=986 /DNA_ORIENTATION=-
MAHRLRRIAASALARRTAPAVLMAAGAAGFSSGLACCEVPKAPLFGGKIDLYNGVVVDQKTLPQTLAEFKDSLEASLDHWQKEGRNGVWMHIPMEHVEYVPVATKQYGFDFHHAEPGYVMLVKWIGKGHSTIPGNASHTVGVGAFVLNDKGEMLAVREKSGPAAQLKTLWKVPTGLIDLGEEVHEAAVREVREETGIDADFEGISSIRMAHGGPKVLGGKSNIYFTVRMTAKNTNIVACTSEIAEAKWMKVEDFLAQPKPPAGTLYHEISRIALMDAPISAKKFPLWTTVHRPGGFNWLYFVPGAKHPDLTSNPEYFNSKLV